MSEFACDALKVPAYYKVDQRTAANIRRTGFTCLKIAEEAVIDPSSFSLEGSKSRQLRRVLRKAQTIDVQHSLPFMSHPVADMRAVHDAWRSTHHGEHGFSMGRFCPDHLSSQRVVLAYDKDRLVGFMTFHVGAKEWTLDLVRITNTAPSGTAQLLITNAIEAAKSDAIRRLSLAAAPIDPVAHLSNSQRIIGHYQDHGLRRFKAAFDPRWEPLYMLAPNRFHLTFCALCLLVAIKSPNQSSRTS